MNCQFVSYAMNKVKTRHFIDFYSIFTSLILVGPLVGTTGSIELARVTYHQQLCLEYDQAYKYQLNKCAEVMSFNPDLCKGFKQKVDSVKEKFLKAGLKGRRDTENGKLKFATFLANFLANSTILAFRETF